MTDARSRLIVALDVPDRTAALAAVESLRGHVGCFKLGLEIFTREGPRIVEEVLNRGERVFLDLKLHDIPHTVAGAVRSACSLGVHMLTVHTAGGQKMLEAARDAAAASASPPLLLGVTALTSLSESDVRSIGISLPIRSWVEQLGDLACRAGIPAIVASPLELPVLRPKLAGRLKFVTPGIRPSGAPLHDQVRATGPREAILAGADFLVIGRPILQAQDPPRAADRVIAEIEKALSEAEF